MDNIVVLAKRWEGPISVAVYTPGDDYEVAINILAYMYQCSADENVREKVSFHFVIDEKFLPSNITHKLHYLQQRKTSQNLQLMQRNGNPLSSRSSTHINILPIVDCAQPAPRLKSARTFKQVV